MSETLDGHRQLTVFVCDDVEDLRFLFRMALEEDPAIEVIGEAGDGASAVEQIEHLKPDVVLLDLAMPVMDGLEAIPLIRAQSPTTKIVVLSGFGEGPASESAREAGAHHYLQKTTSLEELTATVRRVAG